MARWNPFLGAFAAAAALLAAAAPAGARAPSASEQKSLDWVLERLRKDREEDTKTPIKVDPVTAYTQGQTPLEDWKPIADIVGDPREERLVRERAAGALIARFRMEDEQKRVEAKVLEEAKRKVCSELLRLMLFDDRLSRTCIYRLTTNLLPPQLQVKWEIGDPPSKRRKAWEEYKKKLRKD